ncbi:MAG: aspartate-semialdehyde dehydrogenase [Bacteroidales bacterium]|nr:aspartate-semialdehyde dehydrogenase [Bacteroidales bacterium]
MKIAVVGATGLVGSKMLQVLDEQKVRIDELIVAASERSVGKEITFQSKTHKVVSVDDAIAARPDIAIFSAGASASRQYAPRFAETGTFVVDNSSAWRMDKDVPLVVPEINADTITNDTHIIANPNCSTIQMVMALAPIHKAFGIKRLVVATYQSVSGSGLKGINQLNDEENAGRDVARYVSTTTMKPAYPHQIYRNVLPHAGDFTDNGYTTEEEKLVNETRKILRDPSIAITATAARVPVTGGHSEAVNVETLRPFEIEEVRQLLEATPGVVVQDDPLQNLYPMAITAYDKDEVFVGRLRRDHSVENGMNLWVVSDNIRKGAATNAVQIAKYLINTMNFGPSTSSGTSTF